MPGHSDDKTMAAAYVPDPLYDRWCDHADDLDESVSQFIIQMVEAGRKQIDLDAVAADSIQQLRTERNDLRNEVQRQRKRIQELERQMEQTSRTDIVEHVEENPGATAPEIIQHVSNTVPGRTVGHLDLMEGRALVNEDGEYYALNEEADEDETASAEGSA